MVKDRLEKGIIEKFRNSKTDKKKCNKKTPLLPCLCGRAYVEFRMLNVEVQEERKFENQFPVLTFSLVSSCKTSQDVSSSRLSIFGLHHNHTIGSDSDIATATYFINQIRSNSPSSIVSPHDDISSLLRDCYPLRSGRFVVVVVSQLSFCQMHF